MTDEKGNAIQADEPTANDASAESEKATTEQSVQQDATQDAETASSEQDGDDKKSDADTGEDSAEEQPKKLSRSERQRRRLRALSTEIETLKAQLSEKAASNAGDPPKEEDFGGDYLKYQAALSAYETAQAVRKEFEGRDKQAREERLRERQREAAEEFIERAEEFKARVTDFDQAVERFVKAGGKFEPHVVEELQLSEQGPALVYQLASNPQLAAELNAMSPRDAARAIGRLEAKVSLPNPKKQTSAPKPIVPPSGGATPPKDPSNMTMDEYVKWRANGGG